MCVLFCLGGGGVGGYYVVMVTDIGNSNAIILNIKQSSNITFSMYLITIDI